MPSRRVTFVLPFDESDDEEGHDSDFENSFELEGEDELDLDLDEEILLFEDDPDLDSEPEEGTSFIDIEEYLAEIALIEPPELPPAKILDIPSQPLVSGAKSRGGYYDNGTRIQALTLLQ
jgi:hypothetical protein